MTLAELVRHYVATATEDLSQGYEQQLLCWANVYGPQRAISEAFSEESLNHWLREMRRQGIADETRRSRRRMALTLWKSAHDSGLVRRAPNTRKILRIRKTTRSSRAWSKEQVESRLLPAAKKLDGKYPNGVWRRNYWRSWILGGWDGGLRGCDQRRIATAQLQRFVFKREIQDGALVLLRQQKTGKKHLIRLRKKTLDAIRESYPPKRILVWELWGSLDAWRREARALVEAAGLPGSIGLLRHSSGTNFEKRHPNRGHEHLGNTRRVFEESYLDVLQIERELPLPDELEE